MSIIILKSQILYNSKSHPNFCFSNSLIKLPDKCKNNHQGWWGYKTPEDNVGSISTVLNASDLSSMVKGKLKFGNCHNKGYVVAYIDGVEIARQTAQEIKQVEFEFKHGSELRLSEFESGIIHFLKFEVIDCIQGME